MIVCDKVEIAIGHLRAQQRIVYSPTALSVNKIYGPESLFLLMLKKSRSKSLGDLLLSNVLPRVLQFGLRDGSTQIAVPMNTDIPFRR